MVLMSAVMPAPDEGSNPAIVSTTGGVAAMAFTLNRKFKEGKNTSVSRIECSMVKMAWVLDCGKAGPLIFLSPAQSPIGNQKIDLSY